MINEPDSSNYDDDILIFADEDKDYKDISLIEKWKIMIVDDEEEVHNVTKLALSNVSFMGRSLEFIHSYSGKQTIELITKHMDTAIILLDIVMEEDDSGLKVIKYIRESLKNNLIRIIIRTGQPGQAPEKKLIVDYDINDYKEKAELTSQKLFSTIIASLRSYNNLIEIDRNRMGLLKIIEATNAFIKKKNIEEFTKEILDHLLSILNLASIGSKKLINGFVALFDDSNSSIISAIGKYEYFLNRTVEEIVPDYTHKLIKELIAKESSLFINNKLLINLFRNKNYINKMVYIESNKSFSKNEIYLLKILCNTISASFNSICLNKEIEDTQHELLFTLGGVVETRSRETGFHVMRVAEYSKLLALKYGLDEEEAELIKQASPMHDVGKVGIFDAILNKPEKLTPEEFNIIKTHTTIGYELFSKSKRKILKAASIIALEHHEKYDGTGYPRGLKGNDIHIYGRIVSIADIFDAIGSDRVYKKAWELDKTLEFIKEEKGKTFDPVLVDIFFDNLEEILRIRDKYKEI